MCVHHGMAYAWRSENNFIELVLSFCLYVSSVNLTQGTRITQKNY